VSRDNVNFAATTVKPGARAALQADLMVTINHLPTSISLLLTVHEARELAYVILRETEKFLPRKET
jgi:hypothetical protein